MKPVVSVVIAAKNEERFVEEAVRSVLAQEGVEHELVFVDDGSEDSTYAIVSAIAETSPNLRLERNPGRGKVSAFNYGVSLARGDWVCIFAGDDIMPEGSLAARWEAVRAVGSNRPVVGLCRLVTLSETKSQDGHVVPRNPNKGGWTGVSYLMDKGAVAQVFPVPDSLPNEDTWMEVAIRNFDFEIVHSPVIGTKWRIHAGNSINNLLSFEEFDRRATPRRSAPILFLQMHGCVVAPDRRRWLEGYAACEQARRAGNLLGILRSRIDLTEKLRAAAFANRFLYNIRSRFYGLLSGW